jgi:anti-sigma regulatory factor (Ser/Thr protein kinase)
MDRAGTVTGSRHIPPSAPGHGSGAGPAHWPLTTHLELPPLPGAVPSARGHCRLVLAEWGLTHLSDVCELILSELATNAVAASRGLDGHWWQGQHHPGRPPIRLWLHSDGQCVEVPVWDGCEDSPPSPPQPQPRGDSEHGRGLMIVVALSADSGVSRLEGTSGKVVWAVVGP